MALNTLQLNTISRAFLAAKRVQEELYPALEVMRAIYDAPTTGLKATITQQDLDAVPSFGGLTKQQLEDGMYVLTALISDATRNGQVALAQLAARA